MTPVVLPVRQIFIPIGKEDVYFSLRITKVNRKEILWLELRFMLAEEP